ncbi:HAD family hydrolase [Cardiobacterium hominis]|uniref:HAD family hydrolase n=1 Tax=Cardiobacterium hominis TaxID=2718 RepID=UPI00066084B7|nr:HAD-IA family hydrolase [Cardiobacterium hominis]
MSAPYQAVWFDLDGTLLDTAPDLVAAVNRALVQHGHDPVPPEVILPYAGHGSRAMLRHALAADADDPRLPALQEAFYADYLRHIADHTRWFPGMEDLLAALEARGVLWGVVTNKLERFTYAIARHFGFELRAAALVCGDTLAVGKPDPAPLVYACSLAGVRPERCIMIGDSNADVQAASRAGMPSIFCDYGYTSRAELAAADRPLAFVPDVAALRPYLLGVEP